MESKSWKWGTLRRLLIDFSFCYSFCTSFCFSFASFASFSLKKNCDEKSQCSRPMQSRSEQTHQARIHELCSCGVRSELVWSSYEAPIYTQRPGRLKRKGEKCSRLNSHDTLSARFPIDRRATERDGVFWASNKIGCTMLLCASDSRRHSAFWKAHFWLSLPLREREREREPMLWVV